MRTLLFFCLISNQYAYYDCKTALIEKQFRAFNFSALVDYYTLVELSQHARFSHFEKRYQKRSFL